MKIWQKLRMYPLKVRFTRKKLIAIVNVAFVLSFLFALPLISGTKTYPITIINSNSMYPYLQNGDLVFYTSIDTVNIPNGTLIVFTQDQTSDNLLNSVIPPVVIHRVVGKVIQPDGTAYYRTKGDNNQIEDITLVKPENILGSKALIIPKLGFFLLFLRSAQGLVTVVAVILGIYLLSNDVKIAKAKKRDAFIAALAVKNLNGELSDSHFKKFEVAIKHFNHMDTNELTDFHSFAIAEWIKNGGLEYDWKIKVVKCNNCSNNALFLENGKNLSLLFCLNCPA